MTVFTTSIELFATIKPKSTVDGTGSGQTSRNEHGHTFVEVLIEIPPKFPVEEKPDSLILAVFHDCRD